MQISIRREMPTDIDAIHALEAEAFGCRLEADIVNRLRDDGSLWLSLVALVDDGIVGHAAYSLVEVSHKSGKWRFPALGPIAVAPAKQRQGIGSALIRAGTKKVREAGYGLLFLVGSPDYYPRFGFQPALPLGFSSDYVKPGGLHEHFMALVLDQSLIGSVRGHMRYHAAFPVP